MYDSTYSPSSNLWVEKMTLSNSQCIEVAETIWRITVIPDGEAVPITELPKRETKFTAPHAPNGWIFQSEAKERVLSWQGFGRTVETMARDHGMRFLGDRFAGYQGSHIVKSFPIKQPENWDDMRALIPATHLAALEAKESER